MEAPKIRYKLTQPQLEKFCDMFGLDMMSVEPVNAVGCLNTEYIRDMLIKADYDQLTKGIEYIQSVNRKYNYVEINKALAKAYRLKPTEIDAILKSRKNGMNMHFCDKCGKRIDSKTYERTNGLCSECMADVLEL